MPRRIKVVLYALLLWGVYLGLSPLFRQPPLPGLFFLDAGQGDSVLVRAPNGAEVLVDAGPPGGAAARSLSAVSSGDRSVGALLLTHHDLDHSGGAEDLIRRFRVETFLAPSWGEPNAPYLEAASGRDVATGTVSRGDRIWLDRATPVFLDILWPPAGAPVGDGNDSSVVARLTFGSSVAILTGDAPRGVEMLLVGGEDFLDADVLKAGHHGSKTSSAPAFLEAVSPRYVIFSAGQGNRYGHPDESVVAAALGAGAATFSTAALGTVSLPFDGVGLSSPVASLK